MQLFEEIATDFMHTSDECSLSFVRGLHPEGLSGADISIVVPMVVPPRPLPSSNFSWRRATTFEDWRSKLHQAAHDGDSTAQHALALVLLKSIGIDEKDGKEQSDGILWLRAAAESGDANAQHSLAFLLFHGYGVAKDEEEARKWFRSAFSKGIGSSQQSLSIMLFDGESFKEPNLDIVPEIPPAIEGLPPYFDPKSNAWTVFHGATAHRSVSGPFSAEDAIKMAASYLGLRIKGVYPKNALPSCVVSVVKGAHPFCEDTSFENRK